jgi:hypothetical protein
MIRRRPIPRSPYQWKREPKPSSLRYELILNGAVRLYPDGREVMSRGKNPEFRRVVGEKGVYEKI